MGRERYLLHRDAGASASLDIHDEKRPGKLRRDKLRKNVSEIFFCTICD